MVTKQSTLPDGRAVGVDDDGNVYIGTPTECSMSELTCKVDANGDLVRRTYLFPDGTVQAFGDYTKAEWVDGRVGYYLSTRSGWTPKEDELAALKDMAQQAWVDEVLTESPHHNTTRSGVEVKDGKASVVEYEVKATYYDWEQV